MCTKHTNGYLKKIEVKLNLSENSKAQRLSTGQSQILLIPGKEFPLWFKGYIPMFRCPIICNNTQTSPQWVLSALKTVVPVVLGIITSCQNSLAIIFNQIIMIPRLATPFSDNSWSQSLLSDDSSLFNPPLITNKTMDDVWHYSLCSFNTICMYTCTQ